MTSTRRFLQLFVILVCLLEGCKPESIAIPLNADKANPSGSSKFSSPPASSHVSETPEPNPAYVVIDLVPAAQDNSLTPPSTPKPAPPLGASMPGASTPRRGIALPPTPDEEEHEQFEIKAEENALLAAQEDLTKIQNQKATSDAERLKQKQVRELAGHLLSDKAQERAKAINFLKQHKYEPEYAVTLSQIAAQVCQAQGLAGIQKLFRALDRPPREATGLQHLLLQLRCLNECLRIGSPDLDEAGFNCLDEEFQLSKPFKAWLKQGLKELENGRQDLQRHLVGNFLALGYLLEQTNTLQVYILALNDKNKMVQEAADKALKEILTVIRPNKEQVVAYLRSQDPGKNSEVISQRLGKEALKLFQNKGSVPAHHCPTPGLEAYFAGKELARRFLSGTDAEKEQAVEFLRQCKYVPRCETMLSCMAEQVCQEQGLVGIQKLFKAFDEPPREAIGLQHLLLQLRAFNECIPYLDEAGLKRLDEEFQLSGPFNAWLKQGLKELKHGRQDLQRHLVSNFPSLGHVLKWSNALGIYEYEEKLKDQDENVREAAATALKVIEKVVSIDSEPLTPTEDSSSPARSMPKATTPSRSTTPLLPSSQEEEELEIKAGEDALIAAQRDLTNIQNHYKAAKKENSQHELSVEQVKVLRKHLQDLVSDLSGHSQDLRNEITQFLQQVAPKAISDVERLSPEQVKELARDLLSDKPQERAKTTEFLQQHKYERQYQAALSYLVAEVWQAAGLVGIQILLRTLNESGRELLGLQHVLLQLICLNTCLGIDSPSLKKADFERLDEEFQLSRTFNDWLARGLEAVRERVRYDQEDLQRVLVAAFPNLGHVLGRSQAYALYAQALKEDKNSTVRRAAASSLGELVKAAPALAPAALPALRAALKDEDGFVRGAAASALEKLVQAAPALAPEALEALLAALKDKDWNVRYAAADALKELIKAAPGPEALALLLAALKDEDRELRRAAAEALPALVQAAPGPAALEALLAALKDEDRQVRRAAAYALEKLVQAAPALAPAALPALGAALKDEDWEVRQAAAEALEKLVQAAPALAPAALEALLAALKDEDRQVRQAAAYALEKLVQAAPALAPAALPALRAALKDEDGFVRGAAAYALEKLVQAAPALAPAALEALLAALKDEDRQVRQAAAAALGELFKAAPGLAQEALPALLAAMKDEDSDVRRAAASALGELFKAAPGLAPEALEALLAALKDENYWVRSAAASALGELVKAAPALAPAALPALRAALKDEDGFVRGAAASALEKLVQAAPALAPAALEALRAALKDEDWQVSQAAAKALPALVQAAPGPAALEALLAALKDQFSAVRQAAAYALPALVQAAPALAPAALPALGAALKDEDRQVRRAAAYALEKLVQAAPALAPAALEALLAALKDEDWEVRQAAAEALEKLVQAAPALAPAALEALRAALKDEDREVRQAAAEALPALVQAAPGPAALEALLAALKDQFSAVRQAAAYALPALVQAAPALAPAALPALGAALKDEDRQVRRAAAEALPALVQAAPGPAALEALLAALKDEDRQVRQAAASALGELVKAAPALAPAALEALLAALKDEDRQVRQAAASALGELVKAAPALAPAALEALLAALKDEDRQIRQAAASALGELVKAAPALAPAALEALLAALKDKDIWVRGAAASALGELVKAAPALAPAALEALLAALRDEDSAAASALDGYSTKQLIEGYLATAPEGLRDFIINRLYREALVMQPGGKYKHKKLVLYPSTGQPVKWEVTEEEAERLQDLIMSDE